MKFLVIMRMKEENVIKTRERGAKMKTPFKLEGNFLFPMHVIVGTNSAFFVVETDKIEDFVRLTYPLTDLVTFETRPIMDNSELMKFAQSEKL